MSDQPKKRGRPKGSKNRPKWMVEAEKLKPKRGRGRPKGAKNKPKTLEQFVAQSLEPNQKPVVHAKPKNKNKIRPQLNAISPEERSERARKAALARHAKANGNYRKGVPQGWKHKEYDLAMAEAEREAKRIVDLMAEEGILPDDLLAQEAIENVAGLMRGPHTPDLKLKAAQTILNFTKSKPTQIKDVTVRTAEDWLDEVAEEVDETE